MYFTCVCGCALQAHVRAAPFHSLAPWSAVGYLWEFTLYAAPYELEMKEEGTHNAKVGAGLTIRQFARERAAVVRRLLYCRPANWFGWIVVPTAQFGCWCPPKFQSAVPACLAHLPHFPAEGSPHMTAFCPCRSLACPLLPFWPAAVLPGRSRWRGGAASSSCARAAAAGHWFCGRVRSQGAMCFFVLNYLCLLYACLHYQVIAEVALWSGVAGVIHANLLASKVGCKLPVPRWSPRANFGLHQTDCGTWLIVAKVF